MNRLSYVLLDNESEEFVEEVPVTGVEDSACDVIETDAEVNANAETIDEIAEVTETLEGLYASAELFRTEGFDKVSVGLLACQLDSIKRRTGGMFSIPSIIDYSTESASNDALELTLEGIAGAVKSTWEAFIVTLKKLWASLTSFFTKLFISVDKIKSRADEVVKMLSSGNYKEHADPEVTVSVNSRWLYKGSAFNPAGAIEDASKLYNDYVPTTNDVAVKLLKVYKEMYAELKSKGVFNEEPFNNEITRINNGNDSAHKYLIAGHESSMRLGMVFFVKTKINNVDSEQKPLSKADTSKLAKDISALATVLSAKKGIIKNLQDALKNEIAELSSIDDRAANKWFMKAAQKTSVRRSITSLNNTASFVFRIALEGLRFAEASVKKLEVAA